MKATMPEAIINLSELVSPPSTDSISGRAFGERYAIDKHVLDLISEREKIVVNIDDNLVKAINDSFIKGFFSKVFEKLKSKEKVSQYFEIKANSHYKKLFDKNWTVLDAIYNE